MRYLHMYTHVVSSGRRSAVAGAVRTVNVVELHAPATIAPVRSPPAVAELAAAHATITKIAVARKFRIVPG